MIKLRRLWEERRREFEESVKLDNVLEWNRRSQSSVLEHKNRGRQTICFWLSLLFCLWDLFYLQPVQFNAFFSLYVVHHVQAEDLFSGRFCICIITGECVKEEGNEGNKA